MLMDMQQTCCYSGVPRGMRVAALDAVVINNISGFIWILRCASVNADNTHIKHVDSTIYTRLLLLLSISFFLSSPGHA